MAVVTIFGGQDPPVGSSLPVEILLLFHYHAEDVARARIGVEVQVPTEDLGQSHGKLWSFAGVGYGVEQRIANLPTYTGDFGCGENCLDLCVKAAVGRAQRDHPKHAVSVNLIAHCAQLAQDRTAHRQSVPGANVAQVVNRLRRAGDDGGGRRVHTQLFNRVAEVDSGGQLVLGK